MTIKEKIPVWLDCDPGIDDAFAILLLLCNPRFNVIGISTVHGNAPLEAVTQNTLVILDTLKRFNIPVYKGSDRPLINQPHNAGNIHGATGLGDIPIPKQTRSQLSVDRTYVEAIRDAVFLHSRKLVLICAGTLTNISHLLTEHPEVVDHVRYISIMGGAFNLGNITAFAEFNFFIDPHAARHVLAGFSNRLLLAPLNVTHTALATKDIRNRIGPYSDFFHRIIEFSYLTNLKLEGRPSPPVHDPVAVFIALATLDEEDYQEGSEYGLSVRRGDLDVAISGDHMGESTFISTKQSSSVVMGINVQKFWDCIFEALEVNEQNQAI